MDTAEKFTIETDGSGMVSFTLSTKDDAKGMAIDLSPSDCRQLAAMLTASAGAAGEMGTIVVTPSA